ncbi:hypothetical protein B0H14DRAFT_3507492 [Mycena olivaceomarginata]|nr:hypothetical protein B0H14DRAFT_3507492 [Mycena olivaceomarginata]
MDFLLVHASRIHELSLQLPAPQFHQFLRLQPGSFPSLTKITMIAIPQSNWAVDPATLGMTRAEFFAEDLPYGEPDPGILWGGLWDPASVFQCTPKLREVEIHAYCAAMDPHILRIPWASLTNIYIDSVQMGVVDTSDVLKLVVNALLLSFSTGGSQGPTMPLMRAVRLPVQQLTWQGYGRLATRLCVSSVNKLEELLFVFTKLTVLATATFLRQMHTLTHLEIRLSIALTDELMQFLTYDAQAPVLPVLKNLILFDRRKCFVLFTVFAVWSLPWGTG